ncbi:uncharacterized protein LOC122533828 [Frieseomelitta varia]|uniref:uncharacterized protein LOC122533828 n=1 Tax=Frieseomelitta varia TaxID=561572 RepID=UPI001CB6812A|nr:uncharacterized protein LOC122533828 [Frieseomelitta varia]
MRTCLKSGIYKSRDNFGVTCVTRSLTENLKKIKKLKSNKDDLYQPAEINIRNIKKIKYLPTNFQKLIIPKNNTKLNCHFIKKNTDSSSMLNTRKDTNIKNVLDDSQKKAIQSKFIQVLREEKCTLDKTKFENISRVSILLLYLHFLLCYYLSFSKTNHFNEFFETCPVKDTEN